MERIEDRLSIRDPGDPVCAVESFDFEVEIDDFATEAGETQRHGERIRRGLTQITADKKQMKKIMRFRFSICVHPRSSAADYSFSVSLCLCG